MHDIYFGLIVIRIETIKVIYRLKQSAKENRGDEELKVGEQKQLDLEKDKAMKAIVE